MTDNQIDALGNELLSQRFVDRNIFQTAELWGVGSTRPYGHRNDFTTLDEIILAHGGNGTPIPRCLCRSRNPTNQP
jgi:cytochrome c peroxidase